MCSFLYLGRAVLDISFPSCPCSFKFELKLADIFFCRGTLQLWGTTNTFHSFRKQLSSWMNCQENSVLLVILPDFMATSPKPSYFAMPNPPFLLRLEEVSWLVIHFYWEVPSFRCTKGRWMHYCIHHCWMLWPASAIDRTYFVASYYQLSGWRMLLSISFPVGVPPFPPYPTYMRTENSSSIIACCHSTTTPWLANMWCTKHFACLGLVNACVYNGSYTWSTITVNWFWLFFVIPPVNKSSWPRWKTCKNLTSSFKSTHWGFDDSQKGTNLKTQHFGMWHGDW
jgi:hypothetical protein